MKRRQWFEWCDLAFLPAFLRSATPTFLEATFRILKTHAAAVAPLAQVLRATNSTRVLDLGSGGAGPLLQLLDGLAQKEGLQAHVTLTDKFPNVPAFQEAVRRDPARLSFLPESVDATRVPNTQAGVRTLFQLFHHLPPDVAFGVLKDAVRNRQGIAIFEVTERTPKGLLLSLFLPALVFLLTPFVRPFSFLRLLFTYVLPVLPLVILWDGLVSHLRSYTRPELSAMLDRLSALDGPPYVWTFGQNQSALIPVFWLTGYPNPQPQKPHPRNGPIGSP